MTRFPVQHVGTISWAAAERAYETYSRRYGGDQSLVRLAERAGFGLREFADLYHGFDGRCLNREYLIVLVSQDKDVDLRVHAHLLVKP